ncbi:MAG: nuclear transport factor 2 family protein, partial [Pseudomonadota bacterium]
MAERQAAKKVVRDYFDAQQAAGPAATARLFHDDYVLRAVHPFNEIRGRDTVVETVLQPLGAALTALQRREDVFMAGPDRNDSRMWVTSMGKFLGLFDDDWLGIPAT